METELKASFEKYKKYTIEIISCLEREEYDSLQYFMNERQSVLDELYNQNYDKKQLSQIYKEVRLAEYEQKLDNLLIMKRDKVKNEINILARSKSANNMYNRNVTGAVVFSKKI